MENNKNLDFGRSDKVKKIIRNVIHRGQAIYAFQLHAGTMPIFNKINDLCIIVQNDH
jgi:hypothetical protein